MSQHVKNLAHAQSSTAQRAKARRRWAYAISFSMRVGIYDCLTVALAEREGCDFITADDKLSKNLQSKFPFVISLASMP